MQGDMGLLVYSWKWDVWSESGELESIMEPMPSGDCRELTGEWASWEGDCVRKEGDEFKKK